MSGGTETEGFEQDGPDLTDLGYLSLPAEVQKELEAAVAARRRRRDSSPVAAVAAQWRFDAGNLEAWAARMQDPVQAAELRARAGELRACADAIGACLEGMSVVPSPDLRVLLMKTGGLAEFRGGNRELTAIWGRLAVAAGISRGTTDEKAGDH